MRSLNTRADTKMIYAHTNYAQSTNQDQRERLRKAAALIEPLQDANRKIDADINEALNAIAKALAKL